MVANVSTVLLETPFPSSLPCFELHKTFQYLVPWALLVCLLFFHRLVNKKKARLKSLFFNHHRENGIKICLNSYRYVQWTYEHTQCVVRSNMLVQIEWQTKPVLGNKLWVSLSIVLFKKRFDGFNKFEYNIWNTCIKYQVSDPH